MIISKRERRKEQERYLTRPSCKTGEELAEIQEEQVSVTEVRPPERQHLKSERSVNIFKTTSELN
jgi:hypothetical protein